MWGIKGHLGYDPHDKDPENWLKTGFPARYIYEKILPEAVAAHSPGTFYHPSCPYGNAERPDGGSMTIGDTHQWNVWHGTQEPYQNWDLLAGRFVSEFGMEAYPSLTTIDSYLPPDGSERTPFSPTIEFHNKALGACRRIACYLTENILYDHHPLEAYIYSTQLMQAEALSTAYRFWRRNWKGPGRELTSGALVWQLNDCWPATSWSIIDYHLRPKAAYFAIKRELAPIVLGSKRYEVSTPRDKYTNAHVSITHRMQVWVSSFLLEEQTGPYKLVSKTFHVTSGHLIVSETLKHDFSLHPNRSTELVDILLPGINGNTHLDVVVALYLLNPSGQHVARNISWADPLKYVKVSPKPGVGALLWRGKLRVRAELPVKGMVFMGEEMEWGDNCVDLVPGEILQVGVKTEGKKKEVGVRFYGGGEKGVGVSVATEGEWEGVVVG